MTCENNFQHLSFLRCLYFEFLLYGVLFMIMCNITKIIKIVDVTCTHHVVIICNFLFQFLQTGKMTGRQ